MHGDHHDIWPEIQAHLRRSVPASTFEIWLEPLELLSFDEGVLTLSSPRSARAWVSDRFERVLQACAAAVLGPDVTVSVVAAGVPAATSAAATGVIALRPGRPELNPKYTFDQFVIGQGNRLAHAAALAVAELPGQAYNPLFIYGPPGVGKTHLLHSIAHYVRAFSAGLTVRCATVEEFTSEFVAAVQSGRMEAFKDSYRRADVLLIDDVQFLASKVRTEEEFFHTFNALYETGSQLVLSSDRLPANLDAVEDRLRERFEAGLVTSIEAPDRATRLTVLRMRAHADGLEIVDPAALALIADRVTDNVRSLEGALIRVIAYASLTARPVDSELAAHVLDELYPAAASRRPTVDEIQTLTSAAFGITVDELVSANRATRLAWPRQVAMYLARQHTDETLPAIGRAFGGRNHATVLHAVKRATSRVTDDADARAAVADLSHRLCTQGPRDRPC